MGSPIDLCYDNSGSKWFDMEIYELISGECSSIKTLPPACKTNKNYYQCISTIYLDTLVLFQAMLLNRSAGRTLKPLLRPKIGLRIPFYINKGSKRIHD